MNEQKAKHTPGPWKISEKGPGQMSIHLGDFTNENPGVHLASFYSDRGANNGVTESEMSANISLCAAAPELLAALESLLKRGEWHLPQGADKDGMDNIDALATARAAIRKAKGE